MRFAADCLRAVLLAAVVCAGGNARGQFAESEVKAAFIFNVAKYAEWSEQALPAGAALRVCFLDADGHGGELADALARHRGKPIRSHALEVVAGRNIAALHPCHIVVLAPRAAERERILSEGRDMLTLSDSDDFIGEGGIIGLVVADQRVGFEANLASARRAGIRLPAQLLKLARRVHN